MRPLLLLCLLALVWPHVSCQEPPEADDVEGEEGEEGEGEESTLTNGMDLDEGPHEGDGVAPRAPEDDVEFVAGPTPEGVTGYNPVPKDPDSVQGWSKDEYDTFYYKHTRNLTEDDFYREVIFEVGSHQSSVVAFIMPWCDICKRFKPLWDLIAEAMAADASVLVGSVDCEEESEVCTTYKVDSYPQIRYWTQATGTEGALHKTDKFTTPTMLAEWVKDNMRAACNMDEPESCSTEEQDYIQESIGKTSAQILADIEALKAERKTPEWKALAQEKRAEKAKHSSLLAQLYVTVLAQEAEEEKMSQENGDGSDQASAEEAMAGFSDADWENNAPSLPRDPTDPYDDPDGVPSTEL